MMSNRFNYRCPKCGSPDHINILAFVSVTLTSRGAHDEAKAEMNI
jgi:hypothetical protein